MIGGHAQNQFSTGINKKKEQTFSHLLRPTGFVSAGDLLSHCEFQLFSLGVYQLLLIYSQHQVAKPGIKTQSYDSR
jgi:hypothetical protein